MDEENSNEKNNSVPPLPTALPAPQFESSIREPSWINDNDADAHHNPFPPIQIGSHKRSSDDELNRSDTSNASTSSQGSASSQGSRKLMQMTRPLSPLPVKATYGTDINSDFLSNVLSSSLNTESEILSELVKEVKGSVSEIVQEVKNINDKSKTLDSKSKEETIEGKLN